MNGLAETAVEYQFIDPAKAVEVEASLQDNNLLTSIAEIFKVLSDPTRLKIVLALLREEMCVGDLALVTGQSQSVVSHHLQTLRYTNLVNNRRQGKSTIYSLADEHVSALISIADEHAREGG